MTQLGYAVFQGCIIFNDMKCKEKCAGIGTLALWNSTISLKRELRKVLNISK